MNCASDCARNVLFALNIIDGTVASVLVVFGLIMVFNWHIGQEFWYLWMPTFVIGGLLGLMVFLSAFGAWAKQACNCGCFLGLSSCLGIVTMLLELTFAILTLAAKDQVLAAFCKKIAGSTWDSTGKQCTTAGAPSDALGFDDGSGSGGGGHHPDGHKVTQDVLKDYQQWSDIIAYVLFGLAFLHLCRFIMGRYVEPDRSELDAPLNWNSSRDDVENIRARNRFMRSQEAAMRDGQPMSRVDESGEIMIKDESSCVIS